MKITELPFSLDFGNACGLTWLQNDREEVIGAIEYHLTPEGKRCEGMVSFDVPERDERYKTNPDAPTWKVESWNPLTISPSIKCTLCGHHGWIQNGQWVRASDSPC